MISEPEFRSSVPVRHQKELLDAYHKYVKEKSVFQYGRDIRQVLVDWSVKATTHLHPTAMVSTAQLRSSIWTSCPENGKPARSSKS